MYKSHYCFKHLYILNGTCFFFILFCFVLLICERRNIKTVSASHRKSKILGFTQLFLNIVLFQLHTFVGHWYAIGETQYLDPRTSPPQQQSALRPKWFFSLENRWKSLGAMYGEYDWWGRSLFPHWRLATRCGLVRCPGDAINPTGSMFLPKTVVTRQLQPEI